MAEGKWVWVDCLQALEADIQAKGIDLKQLAENANAELQKDDFEREKEELYKK